MFIPVLFWAVQLPAQSWHPFPGPFTYHFTTTPPQSTTTYIHSLRVEDSLISGSDTVFFFNRVLRHLDSGMTYVCNGQTMVASYFESRARQDNVFGASFQRHPSGLVELFASDGAVFKIETQLVTGGSWTFAPGIAATVDSMGMRSFLGRMDSVKYISLSDGHSFELSKQHGFLKMFPIRPSLLVGIGQFGPAALRPETFELLGISEMNVGDGLPGIAGMLGKFEVGDLYHWRQKYDGPSNLWGRFETRRQFLGKTVLQDTIVFEYANNYHVRDYTGLNTTTTTVRYDTIDLNAEGKYALLPGEAMPAVFPSPSEVIFLSQVYYDSTGKVCYSYGTGMDFDSATCSFPDPVGYYLYEELHKEGLGLYFYHFETSNSADEGQFMCHATAFNGVYDSGYVGSDCSVVLGRGEEAEPRLTLLRDGIGRCFIVHGPKAEEWRLFNFNGQMVGKGNVLGGSKSTELPEFHLSAGMYICTVSYRTGEVGRLRFVVAD